MAELSSCNKDRVARKPKIFIICSLQTSLLVPDLHSLIVFSNIFLRTSLAFSIYGDALASEVARSTMAGSDRWIFVLLIKIWLIKGVPGWLS